MLFPRHSQLAGDVLGPSEAEPPVAGTVFPIADEHVLAGHSLVRQLPGDCGREEGLLCLLGPVCWVKIWIITTSGVRSKPSPASWAKICPRGCSVRTWK